MAPGGGADVPAARFRRGGDARCRTPCGLEARPTEYGTLLVSKVYLGRVGRPGTFSVHCLLDPTGRQGASDMLGLVRDGVLLAREEQPGAGALEVLALPARRSRPAPEEVPDALLALLLGHLADRTPLLLHTAERGEGVETLSALAHALPRRVTADLWWSTFVAQPDDPQEAGGPGVGLVVEPFSMLGAEELETFGAPLGEGRRTVDVPAGPRTVDLDAGPLPVDDRSWALLRTYLEHPELFADSHGLEEFVARLEGLVIDPRLPLDDRALDLLGEEVGPAVFARLLASPQAMTRLAEVVRARRRLPYRNLWNAVPALTDQMFAWFGPVEGDPETQAKAQRVICTTMDARNLVRLVARPLSRDTAEYRPVVADRKLASALAGMGSPLEAYEWRVLTEEWGPVVHAAVLSWLLGWSDAPADLARLAEDRPAYVAGLEAVLAAARAQPAVDPADVRARLAGWRGLGAEEWADLLLACPSAPSGAPLAVLARLDGRGVRQVLRRDWPRLAAQAGIPAVVAEELRVRGIGGF
ncbi:hypothetical protein [Raineyella fluvialis]|uniref:Uncharacterized protein n=1 Tax=Raineyella fluvialis TaxID=2662261 RepID=A0A5Q2FG56_9ACTN|nr:hypothetical protein [Raineyella fluvialis]QGF23665.1 hypothetical protein Rai3103_08260 [Raineyella fluvialis]